MCGIFGIYSTDEARTIEKRIVKDATDVMYHRGPDDDGYYISKNIGLGHRRLSIIDLSHGHQPMFNENKSVVLVYNGEIYNYREIRDELLKAGHVFETDCDTEVIVHAYEHWGVDCVHRFNGIFAILLWDSRNKSMWVARDRLGVKPLYYTWHNGIFICASEIKAIFKSGFVERRLNENAVDAFFTLGYVPGSQTMFKGVYKLLPGHFLRIKNATLLEQQYWDFATVEKRDITFNRAKDLVASLLSDSVRMQLMSDVPLGVFLSGGIDSSAVVALINEVHHKSIGTFTVNYDSKYKVGEEEFARIVAEKYNTEHHVFNLRPDDFFSSIDTLIHYAEEPIVEPAGIALYHIAKMARKYATVILSGEGSDEVFGGYSLYRTMRRLNSIHRLFPQTAWNIMSACPLGVLPQKYRKYLDWVASPINKRYMGTSCFLTKSLKKEIYSHDFLSSKNDYLESTFMRYFNNVAHKTDPLDKMLYVDSKTWLVDDLLIKADKMTMAASVELRVPFLDHRLVELAFSLPSDFKIHNGEGKFILKSLLENKLPRKIIYRKKRGFPVPTRCWFSRDLALAINDKIMNNKYLIPWVNMENIKNIIKQHQHNQQDHSKVLMMLLVFLCWNEKYL